MATYSATFDTRISNAETSSNPAFGKVTGDADPASTQTGVITKISKSYDQIKEDIEDATDSIKNAFDGHDHDPGGSFPGGPPIGTGGVRAIAAGAVTNAKIEDLAVTGSKIANGAVTSGKIADNTMAQSKIGTPTVVNIGGGSNTHTKPQSGYVLYSCEGDEGYTSYQTLTTIVTNGVITLRYYGGS